MLGRLGRHVLFPRLFLLYFLRYNQSTTPIRPTYTTPIKPRPCFIHASGRGHILATPAQNMATALSSSGVVVGSHVVWSWLNELNISIPFPPDTSHEIERQYYQLRVTTCTLPSGLVVNFTNMTYKRKRGE